MFKILLPWIIAFRIKTLPAAISPVLVGTALAYKISNDFNLVIFLSILSASIFIQIGTNLSNDLSDFLNGADTGDRLGPIRVAQSGLLTIDKLKLGIIISFSLAILFGFYLVSVGGNIIMLIGLLSIISGILYTAGPYPLGYNGLGDIFVFIFFGVVAVMGTYYLNTLTINIESLVCGIIIGALSTAFLIVNNIRDVKTDAASGKNTLAVKLGLTFSKIEFLIMVLLPYILSLYLYFLINDLGIFLSFFTLPISFNLIYQIFNKTGDKLNEVLVKTARLLFIYSLLLTIGLFL